MIEVMFALAIGFSILNAFDHKDNMWLPNMMGWIGFAMMLLGEIN